MPTLYFHMFVNCICYLFMLQNVFSYRPPLYDLFDKAEFRALHTPSECQVWLWFTACVDLLVTRRVA